MGKKKNNNKKDIIIGIIFALIMLAIGYTAGLLAGKLGAKSNLSFDKVMFKVALDLVIFIIVFIIQMIIHEGGHLIFGLLSGYEFISFRMGSLTIIKENGKFALKKFNIKGTGGQCLMMPKTDNYEDLNYILYNLGGVLINIIVSIISVIILLTVDTNNYIKVVLIAFIFIGIAFAISNGIPMKINGICNDGYNIIAISKDKFAKYCFYTQLKVNGLLSKGMRFRDMPRKWFYVKDDADINNPMITSIKIMEGNYYHDKLDFEHAKKCYEDILDNAPKIIKLYENEIKCELLFYEIINGNIEKVEELYTKELRNYIKVTDCYISRKRLMYAYTLIILKDKEKAEKILLEFEKTKKTYPVKGEIISEEEIINVTKTKSLDFCR